MKIGITGPNGYIGKALVDAGAVPIFADVTRSADVKDEISAKGVEWVFHLAGKSSIQFCEQNPDEAMFVNCIGTRNVAEACAQLGVKSAMLSTYHIWNGALFERHRENSKLSTARNRYGMMKQAAEELARGSGMKIIRTSYVFDKYRLYSRIEKLRDGESIQEPSFLFRSFIYLRHFVDLATTYFVNYSTMPSVLHLSGSKVVSWSNFMKALCEVYGFDEKLVSVRYSEDKSEYPRPWNGGLDVRKSQSLGFIDYDYLVGLLAMNREQG